MKNVYDLGRSSEPIISVPDWTRPFEIMCDASDYAISAVLRQRIDNRQHVIYYASRTLNEAQLNYITTEKEFLAVVLALEKFHQYLLGSKTMTFTSHSTLKYLMQKDTKANLFVGSFFCKSLIRDKGQKGVENVLADHLSRISNAPVKMNLINESFPNEHILVMYREPMLTLQITLQSGEHLLVGQNRTNTAFFMQIRFFFCDDHI